MPPRTAPPHTRSTLRPLFFLDYDGTLAPIVDDPMQAHPHPSVPGVLARLAQRHPLWIVTGRHLRDLAALLPVALPAVGLHGTQRATLGGDITHTARIAPDELEALRRTLPALAGVMVEDKDTAFAVHYRHAPDHDDARTALGQWLADLPDHLDTIWGKAVVEVRPRGHDKGTAVVGIAEEHPGRTPVYLGDDVTDEDAFRALPPDAVTVKIGKGDTAARHRLPNVDAVVAYLQRYLG